MSRMFRRHQGGVQQGDGKRNKGVRIVCLLQGMRMPMESENEYLKITKTGQTASTLTTVQITAKLDEKKQNGSATQNITAPAPRGKNRPKVIPP